MTGTYSVAVQNHGHCVLTQTTDVHIQFEQISKQAKEGFYTTQFTSRNSVTSLRNGVGEFPRLVVFSTPAD